MRLLWRIWSGAVHAFLPRSNVRTRFFVSPSEVVKQYLLDGEEVVFESSPDIRAWGYNQLVDLLITLVLVVMMFVASDSRVTAFGLILEVLLLGSIVVRYARHRFTRYVLTDRRVMRTSGVVDRHHEWIAWRKVTDVSVRRGLTDHWFDTATIKIQSANETSGFQEMVDVPDPMKFALTIVEMIPASEAS